MSIGHRILFVTSEMADFIKAGGLGDISSALPRALRRRHDVRVLIPGYPDVLAKAEGLRVIARLPGLADIPDCDLGLLETSDGLPIYVLLHAGLYQRDGSPYVDASRREWSDNDLRFGRLSLAAAQIASGCGDPSWRAEILHANDWPSALAPAYLAWQDHRVASVFTIHNLAYQGLFERERIHRLGIPEPAFQMNGVEFYQKLSFLKAGLFYSSFVTTVSASYAQEITSPEAGCGLDGLLRMRASQGRLAGILNGIDENWDPRQEPGLYQNFAAGDWRLRKRNTEAVRQAFGLAVSRGPLFAVVSRLVEQKGIDLVIDAADAIVAAGGQIIINGTGDRQIERRVEDLSHRHPGQIAARISFDDAEAKNLFAGSDFLLMPSRFEPCGLSQMYAQRFGSLPVARKIGGLADTIRDGVTGILFSETTVGCFVAAIATAFRTFASKPRLNTMRSAAMARPAGWDEPCSQYELVYTRSIGNH